MAAVIDLVHARMVTVVAAGFMVVIRTTAVDTAKYQVVGLVVVAALMLFIKLDAGTFKWRVNIDTVVVRVARLVVKIPIVDTNTNT